jgi:hypothetical protein
VWSPGSCPVRPLLLGVSSGSCTTTSFSTPCATPHPYQPTDTHPRTNRRSHSLLVSDTPRSWFRTPGALTRSLPSVAGYEVTSSLIYPLPHPPVGPSSSSCRTLFLPSDTYTMARFSSPFRTAVLCGLLAAAGAPIAQAVSPTAAPVYQRAPHVVPSVSDPNPATITAVSECHMHGTVQYVPPRP